MSLSENAKEGLTFTAIVIAILATIVAVIILVGPWVVVASDKYSDWVHCQTSEPFIQHSWNINTYNCPVAGRT